MNRLLCFCCVFICLAAPSLAQKPSQEQRYTDSLLAIAGRTASDSTKARLYFQLSDYWVTKDTLQSEQWLAKGYAVTGRNPYLQAIYRYYSANLIAQKKDREPAAGGYMKADTLLSRFHHKEAYLFRAMTWRNYAVLRQLKDDYKVMTEILLGKAIPFAEQSGDSTILGKGYITLAIIFKNHNQFDKAETYCHTAIQIYRSAHSPIDLLVTAYHTAAETYILSGKLPEAKGMLDSAAARLAPYPDSKNWLDYYAAESMYFTVSGKFAQSLASLDKGIALARTFHKRYEEQRLLLQKFYAFYNQNSFKQAKEVLLALSTESEMMSLSHNRLQVYYGLAETYSALGEMKPAYGWLKRYAELNDSLAGVRLKSDINELEVKFKNAENQKKIAELEAEKTKAALAAKNHQLTNGLLSAVSLILLITAIFSIFFYRNHKKIARQKEINYQQELKEIAQQQQLTTTRAMLEGEDRERERLARDLHDGLGAMLAVTKISLSGYAESLPGPQQSNELEKIIGQVDHSAKELRRIARNMMPETLLKFGLETALRDLCESLMTDTTRIDFQAFGIEASIPRQVQITIYRIVQELLANAIRHAHATSIVVQCSQNKEAFFITVEDNGKGFDRQAAEKGMGISNINNRVEYLEGKMDIESIPGEGTIINIEIHVGG